VAQEVEIKAYIDVDARGMPLKILISDRNVHDSQRAEELSKDFKAKYLIADKGYDSKSIVEFVAKTGMKAVIPSRSNAKMQRNYDKELYKKRHIVENFFLKIKKFMGISTRYTKNISSSQAYLTIASIMLYCNSL